MIKVSLFSFYEMHVFRLPFSEKKKNNEKKRTLLAKKLKATKMNCIVIAENFLFLNQSHHWGNRGTGS